MATLAAAKATAGQKAKPKPAAKANPAYTAASARVASAASSASGAGNVMGNLSTMGEINAFVSKWKLDTAKTMHLLARLSPPRRHHVMANFADVNKYGVVSITSATVKLEQFILQCERTNSWTSAGSTLTPIGG